MARLTSLLALREYFLAMWFLLDLVVQRAVHAEAAWMFAATSA